MSENKKNSIQAPKYETPTALRLDDVQRGMGLCLYIGSSDAESCRSSGNNALGEGCFDTGISAEVNCMPGYSVYY